MSSFTPMQLQLFCLSAVKDSANAITVQAGHTHLYHIHSSHSHKVYTRLKQTSYHTHQVSSSAVSILKLSSAIIVDFMDFHFVVENVDNLLHLRNVSS